MKTSLETPEIVALYNKTKSTLLSPNAKKVLKELFYKSIECADSDPKYELFDSLSTVKTLIPDMGFSKDEAEKILEELRGSVFLRNFSVPIDDYIKVVKSHPFFAKHYSESYIEQIRDTERKYNAIMSPGFTLNFDLIFMHYPEFLKIEE